MFLICATHSLKLCNMLQPRDFKNQSCYQLQWILIHESTNPASMGVGPFLNVYDKVYQPHTLSQECPKYLIYYAFHCLSKLWSRCRRKTGIRDKTVQTNYYSWVLSVPWPPIRILIYIILIMTLASDFSLSISCSLSLSFIFRFSFPVYFSLFLLNKLCVSRNMTNGNSLIESLGSTRTLNTFISLNIN